MSIYAVRSEFLNRSRAMISGLTRLAAIADWLYILFVFLKFADFKKNIS